MSESSPQRPEGEVRPRAAGIFSRAIAEASPTWELELLISGAVLVALFQVSDVIDRTFERLAPHVTDAMELPLHYAHYYGKAIVLTLIATFIIHLASRGYWVGLVGLHSVFPGGVRWDELKYGPITLDVLRERLPSLPTLIARLDNFCSILFSFGFLIVLFFGGSLLMISAIGAVAYLVAVVAFGGHGTARIFSILLGIFAVVPATLTLVDRWAGARLDPNGRVGRAVRRATAVTYRATGVSSLFPVFLTLASNTRHRAFNAVFFLAFFGVLGFVLGQRLVREDRLEVNSYAYLAPGDRFGVNASHYESQRRAGQTLPVMPTIQSDVVREPYVKLFIPYVPERHNEALAAACPGLRPLRRLGVTLTRPGDDDEAPDSAAVGALRCLGKLHPVTLNGAPLTDLDLHFYTNPANSLRGVIAYIPTAALPRGRNVLTVQPLPRPPRRGRPERPAPPHVIPFWL